MKKQIILSTIQKNQLAAIAKEYEEFRVIQSSDKRLSLPRDMRSKLIEVISNGMPIQGLSAATGIKENTLSKYKKHLPVAKIKKTKAIKFKLPKVSPAFKEMKFASDDQDSSFDKIIRAELPSGVKLFIPLDSIKTLMPLLKGELHAV